MELECEAVVVVDRRDSGDFDRGAAAHHGAGDLQEPADERVDVGLTVGKSETGRDTGAAQRTEGFTRAEREDGVRDPLSGIMHRALIGLLGMPMGELWNLDALATACASDQRWSFLLTVAPLSVVGGVGSPANAIAQAWRTVFIGR